MRVFILGSGFSRDAGYPLTNQLRKRFGDFVRRHGEDYQKPWEQFKQWRDRQIARGGSQAHICSNQNPEYLFTYLDIASKAFPDGEEGRAVVDDEPSDAAVEESPLHSLLLVMSRYFASKHLTNRIRDRKMYKSFFSSCIRDGDVIITFNYDTLPERFLLKSSKWCPGDGYGFGPNLERECLRASISKPTSTVKILKLHGSVGWLSGGHLPENKITLSNKLLEGFGLIPRTDRDWDDLPKRVMLAPSFVKIFEHPEYYNLWSQAAQALRDAEDVVVIGYSLPEADGAAVALVTGALQSKRSRLLVVDPAADELRERYKMVTGGRVSTVKEGFAKWADDCFTGFPPASS